MEQLLAWFPVSTYEALLAFFEALIFVALAIAVLVLSQSGWKPLDRVTRAFGRLARRRSLAVLTVGLVALIGRAAILPIYPPGEPRVHDEFSYLLQADTFASGRLSNQTHPMWIHFESIHIIQQPTCTSKYPPAQGLALAGGIAIGSHPWVGVWISCALMCATLCWMLQGWLPPGWALLGGLICAMKLGLFSYWSTSYWGGAVAAIGGNLVLGALPRILKRPSLFQGTLVGVGIAILANSRPFEGLVMTIPMAIVIFIWVLRQRRWSLKTILISVAIPVVLILAVTAGAMTFYFWSVTGDPLTTPYQVYINTFKQGRPFVWQEPMAEPLFRHEVLRKYWRASEIGEYRRTATLEGYLWNTVIRRPLSVVRQLLGPAFILPLLFLPWVLRDRRVRILIFFLATLVVIALVLKYFHVHYMAPFLGIVYALALQGMRHLNVWRWRGQPKGRALARLVVAFTVVIVVGHIAIASLGYRHFGLDVIGSDGSWSYERARIIRELQRGEDLHLIIVRYGPEHIVHNEWVYNDADIDRSEVVWAREMDEEHNRELIRYFDDRRVWLLEAEKTPVELIPYPLPGN